MTTFYSQHKKITGNNQKAEFKGGSIVYDVNGSKNELRLHQSFVKLIISGNNNMVYNHTCTTQLQISGNNNILICNNTVLKIMSSGCNNKVLGSVNMIYVLKDTGLNNKWQQEQNQQYPPPPYQQQYPPPPYQQQYPPPPYHQQPNQQQQQNMMQMNYNSNQRLPTKQKNVPGNLLKLLGSTPHKGHNKSQQSQCTICLCEIEQEELETFLFCLHSFHTKCINDWFQKSTLCPLCQQDVIENLKQCQKYQ